MRWWKWWWWWWWFTQMRNWILELEVLNWNWIFSFYKFPFQTTSSSSLNHWSHSVKCLLLFMYIISFWNGFDAKKVTKFFPVKITVILAFLSLFKLQIQTTFSSVVILLFEWELRWWGDQDEWRDKIMTWVWHETLTHSFFNSFIL